MSNHLLALALGTALVTTLAGCSDSDSDDGPSDAVPSAGGGTNTGTDTGTGGGDQPTVQTRPSRPDGPRGSGAPSGDTRAGNYFGSLGFGDGVYVIDSRNELFGFVLDTGDSSGRSFFGNVGDAEPFVGPLRTYTHNASNPAAAGGFGTGPTSQQVNESTTGEFVTAEYTMSFVPGQTIVATDAEGNENTLLFVLDNGQIPAASAASVAGAWRGVNQFSPCEAGSGCQVVFDITFDGTTISGATSVQDGTGTALRENPISGTLSEYGDTLLLNFSWTSDGVTSEYEGAAFFTPDSTGRLVFLGETSASDAGLPVLASLLVAQP